jgi:hypothetical protein
MTDDATPYVPHVAGDPITAEDWNAMQVQIKEHIAASIDAAKEEIRKTGVDQAGNSDRFATRSDTEWEQALDERYAGKSHEHEGASVYRRYIKEFSGEEGMDQVFLQHDMNRFPLADLYELDPVTTNEDYAGCRLLFYYGHEDEEELGLAVRIGRERKRLGLPFEEVLRELGVRYDDDASISDVLNEMWDALRKDPNDEIKHCTTTWVEGCCREDRSIAELRRAQQWDDLYLAIRPRKCAFTCGTTEFRRPEAEVVEAPREKEARASAGRATKPKPGAPPQLPGRSVRRLIEVTHVDYDTLHLRMPDLEETVDLMILLRA